MGMLASRPAADQDFGPSTYEWWRRHAVLRRESTELVIWTCWRRSTFQHVLVQCTYLIRLLKSLLAALLNHEETLRLSCLETITYSSCFRILRCNSPANREVSRLSHCIRSRLSWLAPLSCEPLGGLSKNINFKCLARWGISTVLGRSVKEQFQSLSTLCNGPPYPWLVCEPSGCLSKNISSTA